jgi:cell division septation protein DedD
MVMAYLRLHPGDKAVAAGWLEAALHRDEHTAAEQELAARISEALSGQERIQRLVMELCLVHRRADFEAMQIYRRMWRMADGLPEAMLRDLCRVMLNEGYIDDWALQVYLKAYSLGESGALEGIAAGAHHLKANVENGRHLTLAREIISGLDENHRLRLRRQFAPPQETAPVQEPIKSAKPRMTAERIQAAGRMMEAGGVKAAGGLKVAGRGLASLGRVSSALLKTVLRKMLLSAKALRHTVSAFRSHAPKVRQAAKSLGQETTNGHLATTATRWSAHPKARRAATMALIAAASGIVLAAGWRWAGQSSSSTPTAPAAQTPSAPEAVTDPFTIQVAAYLKPEDAQRFVDRLKKDQIDAFWSKAVSANRTWYQVKVSHFATKDQAVKYGETLKAKGLIDDFYVSNYTRQGK